MKEFFMSQYANGIEDGKWVLPCGAQKRPEDSKCNNFVLIVLTLHHAFQILYNKNSYILFS